MHNINRREAGLIDKTISSYMYVRYKCWLDDTYEEKNREEIDNITNKVYFIKQYQKVNNIKSRNYYDLIEIDRIFELDKRDHVEVLDEIGLILDNHITLLTSDADGLSYMLKGKSLDGYRYNMKDMDRYIYEYYKDLSYEDINSELAIEELQLSFKKAKSQLLNNISHITDIKDKVFNWTEQERE